MSEARPTYLTLEQELDALDLRDNITNDPSASNWLKRAVAELWERDVVDALNDLDTLRELLEAKHKKAVVAAVTQSPLLVKDDTSIQKTHLDDLTGGSTDKLWVAGWMWGKYPEHAATYQIPQDEVEAAEWLEGFRWGATESAQFHRLWEWLDETLAGHDAAIRLINKVAGNP